MKKWEITLPYGRAVEPREAQTGRGRSGCRPWEQFLLSS